MPSGRIHEAINLVALGGITAAYLYNQSRWPHITDAVALGFALSYVVGTFMVTPDLDLAEQKVRAKSYWGVLGWLWVPYGLLFSHRGWSHSWIVGPLSRLIYLGLIGALVWFLATAIAAYLGTPLRWPELSLPPNDVIVGAAAGYYVSQWLHLVADGAWPDRPLKRRR